MYHPWNQIDVDEGTVEPPDTRGHRMGVASVEPDDFDVLTRIVVVADQAAMGFWAVGAAVVGGYAVVVTAVCMLACVVPMRRALAVQPMDALQVEG
jgi:hypothetical protein